MSTPPSLEVVFWGHACIGIHVDGAPYLLVDPFDPEGLAGVSGPPAIPHAYRYVIATHDHSDHAAFHTQPDATILHATTQATPLTLEDDTRPRSASSSRAVLEADSIASMSLADSTLDGRVGENTARENAARDESTFARTVLEIHARRIAHDEFGGRLRGGTTLMLDIRIGGVRIVHSGDIGERLQGATLDWLCSPRPDLLIVPAGGYYTLGPDGAAELAAAVQPRNVLFCHTRDDGLPLPQLADRSVVQKRTNAWSQSTASRLTLLSAPSVETRAIPASPPPSKAEVRVVWLTRPDGKSLKQSEQHG